MKASPDTTTRHIRTGILAILIAALLPAAGCRGKSDTKKGAENRPVPVTTAIVTRKPVDLVLRAIGAVEAAQSATIRAQVGGSLTNVAFREGDEVIADQPLFLIDSRTYESDLHRAEAALARDRAQLDNAEREAKRYEELAAKDYVSKSQYDAILTGVESLKSTVVADEQAVESARLEFEYATVRAPIGGRTGPLLAHVGDAIRPDDTALTTINQIKPILVRFSVPSANLADIRKYGSETNLPVRVRTSGDSGTELTGFLCFIDNAINNDTGTIMLKARFDNATGELWPGQFVDTFLVLNTETDALTVPSVAVQPGQEGLLTFVVKPDMSVEKRTVEVARTMNGATVIAKGLEAGEQVVTDGQLRLVPGAKVEIKAGK